MDAEGPGAPSSPTPLPFPDRADAGRRLGVALAGFRSPDVVVLGLPRGGVPVAAEVARILGAPLDVIVVRKLGLPRQPELAMGAIGEDGVRVLNRDVIARSGVTPAQVETVEAVEREELDRRVRRLRRDRAREPLRGRTAIVVDDGVATGATARAACQVARAHGAARVVLAVPIASPRALDALQAEADEVVCLAAPRWFGAVGEGYRHFGQVSDQAVVDLLAASPAPRRVTASSGAATAREQDVEIPVGDVSLGGRLTVPPLPLGLVVFAHGSGSSRHSPRNRHVAHLLHEAGLGTLLFDLLTGAEETDRALVFDIGLLAERLVEVTTWLHRQEGCQHLPLGYFGASTGAAAALWAAADPRTDVRAVVSRGGRPDLAAERLALVTAPTLLIVGGADGRVLDLNRHAQALLRGESRIAVVRGATHLFEEPGALDHVARLASIWFRRHLPLRDAAAVAAGTANGRPTRDG